MLSVTSWGGSGQPIYFIHGFGADSQSWVANVPVATSLGSAYGIDLPAHGQSQSVPAAASLESIAAQVTEAIDTSVPCHLIGHSVGGAIAMLCAAELPVLSISLVAPVGLGLGVDNGFLNALTEPGSEADIKTRLQSMVVNDRLISDQAVRYFLQHLQRTGVRENLRVTAHAIQQSIHQVSDGQASVDQSGGVEGNGLLAEAISALIAANVPRQVFWGAQDTINPLSRQDEHTFGGDWHIFEKCGHLPQIEHRAGYNDALKSFISKRG